MNNWYIDRSKNFIHDGLREILSIIYESELSGEKMSTAALSEKFEKNGTLGKAVGNPNAAFTRFRDHGLIRMNNTIGESAKMYLESKFTFGELTIDLFIKRFANKESYPSIRPVVMLCKLFSSMMDMGLDIDDIFITYFECHEYLLPINSYDEVNYDLIEKILLEREYGDNGNQYSIKHRITLERNEEINYSIWFNALKQTPLFIYLEDNDNGYTLRPNQKQREFFKYISENADEFKDGNIQDNPSLYEYYCNREYGISEIISPVIKPNVKINEEDVKVLFDYLFGYDQKVDFDYSSFIKHECFGTYFAFISIPNIAIAKIEEDNPQIATLLYEYVRNMGTYYLDNIDLAYKNLTIYHKCTKEVENCNIDNKNEFINWMKSKTKLDGEPYFKENTIKHYVSALNAVSQKFNLISIFSISDLDIFDTIDQKIRSHKYFVSFNKSQGNGALSAGLIAYRKFLCDTNDKLTHNDTGVEQPVICGWSSNENTEEQHNYTKEEKNAHDDCVPYDKEKFLADVFLGVEEYETLKQLLDYKKNIILQGSPGVGKTYLAKRLAYSLMGVQDTSRVELVQFHQNYSYEDFMMGYKPVSDGFILKEGIFYNFCKKAEKDGGAHYFIIDEINRGNVSKIFGELMVLLENDKRGVERVKLAYRDEEFTVPENVYIIGMMNTADRSLAIMDYALRRRFSFFEVDPAFAKHGFKKHLTENGISPEMVSKIIQNFTALNEYISDEKISGLGSGFRIGHSYFCGKPNCDEKNWYDNIVKYEIVPMLEEYWFDEKDKVDDWIGKIK